MSRRFDVIYENGVFRPLEPIELPEHHRGSVTLTEPEKDWLDTEYMDSCAEKAKGAPGLEVVRKILSKIPDSLTDVIRTERDSR